MLTGLDDSAIVAVEDPKTFNAAKQVRLEVVNDMIAEIEATIEADYPDTEDLMGQLKRLEGSIDAASSSFAALQTSIRGLMAEKQTLARAIPDAASRLDEVNLHIDRFEQLQEVYASDVARLEALEEAGFLLGLSAERQCPLCGAPPDAQVHAHDHQDIALVREAALVEIAKIRRQAITSLRWRSTPSSSFWRMLIPRPDLKLGLTWRSSRAATDGGDFSPRSRRVPRSTTSSRN